MPTKGDKRRCESLTLVSFGPGKPLFGPGKPLFAPAKPLFGAVKR